MKTITLNEYVENHSQTKAAGLLGCTQGAIRLTLIEGRKVYLVFDDAGRYCECYEIAKYPRRGNAHAA